MEIKQLAFVLEKIDTIFTEKQVLAATDKLIVALEKMVAGESTAATLNHCREQLYALHTAIEPTHWTSEQLALLDSYGGRTLLGQSVIAQINAAFIDNLMNPTAVLAVVQEIRAQSAALHTRAQALLADLDPALINADVMVEEIVEAEYDIIDEEGMYADGRDRNVVQLIRDRLGPVDMQPVGDTMPMRVKVMAAVPVALAVAGKALDLYLRNKQPAVADQVKVGQSRPAPQPGRKPVNNTSGHNYYYYRRTVTITKKADS